MLTRKRKHTPQNKIRECKCISHTQNTVRRQPSRVHTISNRDFPAVAVKALVDEELLSKRSKYICNVCVDYGLRLSQGASPPQVEDNNTDEELESDQQQTDDIPSLLDKLITLFKTESNHCTVVKEKPNKLLQIIGQHVICPQLKVDTDKFHILYRYF